MKIFRLPFTKFTPPAEARRLVRRAMSAWKRTDDGDVQLVATELMQNAIEHTDNGGELVLQLNEDAVLVQVSDNDPRMPEPRPADLTSARGRGLLLIQAVCRRWGTLPRLPRGKVIWAELTLAT